MGFNPRMMVSIGYRSFVDIETHQSHTQFDGAVQCWILDACLTCHDHRDRQRQTRRVHHPVSVESSVGPSEPMPPGTDRTLSIGRLERQSLQARHDRIISRGDLVFGKQHHDIAVVPSGHPFVLETRCPLSFLLDKRQIALLATGKQSQSIERSRDRIEPSGIGGILHPLGKLSAALFEDPFGLWTIVGGRGAISSQDRYFHSDLFRASGTPAAQRQFAVSGFAFGSRQRLAHLGARVIGKRLSTNP